MRDAISLIEMLIRCLISSFAIGGLALAVYQFYSGGDWHFWAFIALWSAIISEERA